MRSHCWFARHLPFSLICFIAGLFILSGCYTQFLINDAETAADNVGDVIPPPEHIIVIVPPPYVPPPECPPGPPLPPVVYYPQPAPSPHPAPTTPPPRRDIGNHRDGEGRISPPATPSPGSERGAENPPTTPASDRRPAGNSRGSR